MGRAGMDECPSRYPGLATELGPLLQVCQRLQDAFNVEPSPLYAQAARERFLAAVASRRRPDVTSSPATPAPHLASDSEGR